MASVPRRSGKAHPRIAAPYLAALDSIISGSWESSPGSTLEEAQGNGGQAQILDGLLHVLSASDYLAEFSQQPETIEDQIQAPAGGPRTPY